MTIKKVCVIGLGYIGLPTAAILCKNGVFVVGIDVKKEIVSKINNGEVHISEPGLEKIVKSAVSNGRLRASQTVETADAFIITVPTPLNNETKHADLGFIRAACKTIAPALRSGNLVVLESTSPVGTTEKIRLWLRKMRSDLSFASTSSQQSADINIAYCPERVIPGYTLDEIVSNDRVIGGLNHKSAVAARSLYKKFVIGDCYITDARTAELSKLVENSFRDVKIAFANELSKICDKQEIDVWNVISLANKHPRVNILQPGPGVGGHCIAIDPWFIVSSAKEEAKLISTSRIINEGKPEWVINKIKQALREVKVDQKTFNIGFFGLTYKSDSDDLRESPALEIVTKINNQTECNVYVIEPNIDKLPNSFVNNITLINYDTALREMDMIVTMVGHKQFKDLKNQYNHNCMVVDTCGLFFETNFS